MGFQAGSDHKILLSRIYQKAEFNKEISTLKKTVQRIPSKKLEQKIGCHLKQNFVPLKLEQIIKIHHKNYKMAATIPKTIKNPEESMSVFEVTKLLLAFVNPKLGRDFYVQQFQEKAKEFYDN